MLRKFWIFGLSVLLLVVALSTNSYSKEYPAKPIELLVGFQPGGTADLGARVVAEVAKKYLGQPLVVVNKSGAAGSIAVSEVINTKPDGYKIIFLSDTYLGTAVKTQKVPFDPNQLAPLVNFMGVKMGLVVRSDSPWTTLKQVLDYAKQNPGKVKWNHPNRSSIPHINALMIFRKAGVEMTEVSYKGSPEQMAGILGGHVDLGAIVYATARDQIKAGKLRALATLSDKRYPETPNVPSAMELGFTEQIVPYYGVYVHKDTPEDIKKILYEAFKKTHEDPDLKRGMEKVGEELRFGGPKFMKESIKKIEDIGVPILKEIGLYAGGK